MRQKTTDTSTSSRERGKDRCTQKDYGGIREGKKSKKDGREDRERSKPKDSVRNRQ